MSSSLLGSAVLRTEDPALITGAAQFVEDLRSDGALHAVFVRSFLAHARINGIDTEAASAMLGVAGVFTAADLSLPPSGHGNAAQAFVRPRLAEGVVRFVGEPVAVVLAETREQAMDAAEAVMVDYEPLPVVVDPIRALEPDAPVLFPDHGSNLAFESDFESEVGALEGGEIVVRGRFVNQRLAPVPMEGNGALARPDPETGGVTVWASCQAPHWTRDAIAEALGLPEDAVRVIAPAVGGGFGAKIGTAAEQIVGAALAQQRGRPVRYTPTRSEVMTAMNHGRGQVQFVEMAATRDGVVTGLRVRIVADGGAYPGSAAFLPELTYWVTSGPYRLPRVEFKAEVVCTNTTPVGAYRGAGRPEGNALVERAMDLLAAEVGLDPVEVRRRNLVPKDAFPYTSATGAVYDSGDYERALDEALSLVGYEQLRKEQEERRESGDARQLGVGVSCYVEVTALEIGREFGSAEVHPDGTVTVLTGISPHGQGHETSLAQVAASTLGVPLEAVKVLHSDTGLVPRGEGTMGSRSLQAGGTAVLQACEGVIDKARRIAAHLLEVGLDDVVLHDGGRVGIAGAPERSLSWPELATSSADEARLPAGLEPGLAFATDFSQSEHGTFPFGTHVAVVEVDTETGLVHLLRHVAVDDCGRIVNPALVEGQVHGGVAQGAAQALFEEVLYDDAGNPLTGNLMTYAMPSAADLPSFDTAHTETPTPLNPLGAKGIGEAGTIGSTPAVQNAVIDALSHLGVRHIDMPLSPERVWRAIRQR